MGFLNAVADDKRERLKQMKLEQPLEHLKGRVESRQRGGRSFLSSLSESGISVIAEIKRASPSRGLIAPGIRAAETASLYERAGARAVSVLTEERYFQGSYQDLREASGSTRLPVLCKDFVVDSYQVWAAADCGASAVLLIARLLGDDLEAMVKECQEAKIEALVEVHSLEEAEMALETETRVIGVNCRDLDSLEMKPEMHEKIKAVIPPQVVTVAESGIRDWAQVRRLAELGYDAILVGESLVQADDPAMKLRELLGQGCLEG